jgi:dihydrofolate reductase
MITTMKRVILNLAVTLDGFIEGPNGEIDWCIMDDDMNFDGFIESIDTIFYGSVSYDAWGNFQPDENATASEKSMWESIHAKSKFVFSRQDKTSENATFISSDIARKVAEIKKQEGKDIWLYGGASLINTFLDLSLIDVYKLSIHPVALGSGKPLFKDLKERVELKLTDTRVFKSGVVELTFVDERSN